MERNINQNPMPHFDILPHPLSMAANGVSRAVKAVGLFLRDRHSIPYAEHARVDEMLLTEDVSGAVDRTEEYWQPVLDWADEHGNDGGLS